MLSFDFANIIAELLKYAVVHDPMLATELIDMQDDVKKLEYVHVSSFFLDNKCEITLTRADEFRILVNTNGKVIEPIHIVDDPNNTLLVHNVDVLTKLCLAIYKYHEYQHYNNPEYFPF